MRHPEFGPAAESAAAGAHQSGPPQCPGRRDWRERAERASLGDLVVEGFLPLAEMNVCSFPWLVSKVFCFSAAGHMFSSLIFPGGESGVLSVSLPEFPNLSDTLVVTFWVGLPF